MAAMDIQPKISKKQYLIAIGVAVFLIIIILLVVIFKAPKQNDPAFFKNTKSKLSFLTNRIDSDFLNPFKKAKPETKTPPPDPVEVADITPPPELEEPEEIKFDELFNHYQIAKKREDEIKAFLSQANQSSQIRTYQKFENQPKEKVTKIQIDTGYEQLNITKTSASYPVDLTRVLTADRRIDALLIEDIDSTLGGKVTAQIENNIYAAQGRNILIPIGSKAVGQYQPLNKVGETRLQIIWQRIITPKGVNIVINSQMTDAMGRSGITGEVDTKFWDKYGLAILISTVSAVAQASANVNVDRNSAIFVNTYGKELTNISAKILDETINIKPSIRIAAGSRILISPTQDIWFRDNQGKIEIQAKINNLTTRR